MKILAGFNVKITQRFVLAALAVVQFLALLTAFTKPAYGYVDPGSGLLAVQVGGSMLAGGLFILRSKLRKLFRMSPQATVVKPDSKESATPESVK
jgi:hypothetical protein